MLQRYSAADDCSKMYVEEILLDSMVVVVAVVNDGEQVV